MDIHSTIQNARRNNNNNNNNNNNKMTHLRNNAQSSIKPILNAYDLVNHGHVFDLMLRPLANGSMLLEMHGGTMMHVFAKMIDMISAPPKRKCHTTFQARTCMDATEKQRHARPETRLAFSLVVEH